MNDLLEQIATHYGATLEKATPDQLTELISAMVLQLEVRHMAHVSDSKFIEFLSDEIMVTRDTTLIEIAVVALVRLRFGPQMRLDPDVLTEDYVLE